MIIGKRVRLRAIEEADLPRFVVWLNDPEVRSNISIYYPLSIELEKRWYQLVLDKPVEEHPLGIEVKTAEGWALIGNTGFISFDGHSRFAEVGIFIGEKSCWNQGCGSEAMRLMLQYGFKNLNLNRVYLRVFETNRRAIHVYEKIGFIHEGRMRQAVFLDGKYIDVLFMSVLRDEWHESEVM